MYGEIWEVCREVPDTVAPEPRPVQQGQAAAESCYQDRSTDWLQLFSTKYSIGILFFGPIAYLVSGLKTLFSFPAEERAATPLRTQATGADEYMRNRDVPYTTNIRPVMSMFNRVYIN